LVDHLGGLGHGVDQSIHIHPEVGKCNVYESFTNCKYSMRLTTKSQHFSLEPTLENVSEGKLLQLRQQQKKRGK
jgi:hypothetical protein